MLSSRLPNALYADKENSTAVASSRNTQSILKTPGAKPTQIVCARTVKASSSKQKPESRRVEHYKGIGAATIALEPGARVLGAKDGNNRSGFAARGHSQAAKGKGKAFDSVYEDCSLMRSIAHAPTAKTSSQTVCYKPEKQNRIASTPRLSKQQRTTKTPAGVKSSTAELLDGTVPAPLKTPCFEASQAPKRASPAQSGFLSTHSAFKTPSPNLLLRRRKGGGSPVPLHFPNPTSLKSDDITEDLLDSKPPRLTLLEELDAQHSLIDNMSEVDYATRQAADQTVLPVDLPFEIPDYRNMGILEINFQGFVSPEAYWASDQPPVLISSNDADIHLRDYIYEDEPQREQLFASPKKTRKPPPTIPGSRALQKSVSKSCRKQVQTSIDQAQHLPKLSSDASRRKLVTYQHRTEYAIPILTSASARLPAKATARDKAPCRRPELEDLPEAVVFQIEEMDLLP